MNTGPLWPAPAAKPRVAPAIKVFVSLSVTGLVALVGTVNYWTGHLMSVAPFFLVPIVLGVVWVSLRFSLVISFVSALLWVGSEIAAGRVYSAPWIPVWNWLVRGLFLCAFSVFVELFLRERRQSLEDPLAGIANRRWFQIFAEQEIRRFRRYRQPFTALYLDCDDFKAVNDRLGHTSGDRLIRDIGRSLSGLVRASDCVARLGGDEFGVILLGTDPDKAQMAAEKLRRELRSALEKLGWRINFSIGAVTFLTAPGSVDEILRASDTCMYGAKRAGKNSVYHQTVGDFRHPDPPSGGPVRSKA